MGMLSSPGPVNWEIARQIARSVALEGGAERPAEPAAPAEFAELARAAQTHVADLTGLAASLARAGPRRSAPSEWADLHLNALRPVLEALARTLGGAFQAQIEARRSTAASSRRADPLAGLLPMLAPVLLGLQAGSMIGYLAHHALGRYDLPLPTADTAEPVLRRPSHRRLRGRVEPRPRRPPLLPRRPRGRPRGERGRCRGCATGSCSLSSEYVSAYHLDPASLESRARRARPERPAGVRVARRATRGAARRDAHARAGRDPGAVARVHHRARGLRRHDSRTVARATRAVVRADPRGDAAPPHRARRSRRSSSSRCSGSTSAATTTRAATTFCAGVIERAGLDGLNRLWTDEDDGPHPGRARSARAVARTHRPAARPEPNESRSGMTPEERHDRRRSRRGRDGERHRAGHRDRRATRPSATTSTPARSTAAASTSPPAASGSTVPSSAAS